MNDRLVPASPLASPLSLEPYVAYFNARNQDQEAYVFPFQLMGYCMLFFLAMGFYFAFFKGDSHINAVVIWLMCIFAPFYVPGVYHYAAYLARDRHTELELDTRHEWIKYSNVVRGENLLFRADQIESCEVNCSILFPYRIDYLVFRLEGGQKIHVSSLVAEPYEILSYLAVPYELRRHWFNSAPEDWAPEPVIKAA